MGPNGPPSRPAASPPGPAPRPADWADVLHARVEMRPRSRSAMRQPTVDDALERAARTIGQQERDILKAVEFGQGLLSEVADLQQRREALEKLMAHQESGYSSRHRELQVREYAETIKSLEEAVAAKDSDIHHKDAALSRTTHQVTSLRHELDEAHSEIRMLRIENLGLQQILSRQAKGPRQVGDTMPDGWPLSAGPTEEARGKPLDGQKELIRSYETQLQRLRQQLQETEAAAEQERRRAAMTREDAEVLRAQLLQATSQQGATQTALDAALNRATAAEQRLRGAVHAEEAAAAQLARSVEAMRRMQTKVAALQTERTAMVQKLETALQRSHASRAQLQRRLDAAVGEREAAGRVAAQYERRATGPSPGPSFDFPAPLTGSRAPRWATLDAPTPSRSSAATPPPLPGTAPRIPRDPVPMHPLPASVDRPAPLVGNFSQPVHRPDPLARDRGRFHSLLQQFDAVALPATSGQPTPPPPTPPMGGHPTLDCESARPLSRPPPSPTAPQMGDTPDSRGTPTPPTVVSLNPSDGARPAVSDITNVRPRSALAWVHRKPKG